MSFAIHRPRGSTALATTALLLLAVAIWRANVDVCPGCQREDVFFSLHDGTSIRARLYLPPGSATGLPAVIVCHGYLANLNFMEVPWAADLTKLGAAALFLDRRGHGQSGGNWWPSDPPTGPESPPMPEEIASALAYLRARAPTIDPEWVGFLGHSEGGSAAIAAATADWDARATVALSPSAAQWELVNHVVPANFLLVYGEDDSFVLPDTAEMLIRNATRGYLSSAGQLGRLADGSARRLMKVPGHGHVTVLHSEIARREALEWIRDALRTEGEVSLSPVRFAWVGTGAAAILMLVAAGVPARPLSKWLRSQPVAASENRELRGSTMGASCRALALVGVWCIGIVLFPRLAAFARLAPRQEGWVVTGLLVAESLTLVAVGSVIPAVRRSLVAMVRCPRVHAIARWQMAEAIPGIAAAVIVLALLRTLLSHLYSIDFASSEWILAGFFVLVFMPAFLTLEVWLGWVGEGDHFGSEGAALISMAALTSTLGGAQVERMAVLPVYLVAATLLLLAAFRAGFRRAACITSPIMAAMFLGMTTSAVCPRY